MSHLSDLLKEKIRSLELNNESEQEEISGLRVAILKHERRYERNTEQLVEFMDALNKEQQREALEVYNNTKTTGPVNFKSEFGNPMNTINTCHAPVHIEADDPFIPQPTVKDESFLDDFQF